MYETAGQLAAEYAKTKGRGTQEAQNSVIKVWHSKNPVKPTPGLVLPSQFK